MRSLVGHGIGRSMHEEPQIPNYGPAGKGVVLEEGMVLAIEPMVTAGRHMVRMGDDGWAIYSQDGSLAAHFEFTVAITADGPRILTPWHESPRAPRPDAPLTPSRSTARRARRVPAQSASEHPEDRASTARGRRLAAVALPAPRRIRRRVHGRARRRPGRPGPTSGPAAGTPGRAAELISPGTQPARVAPQRPG